MSEKRLQSPVRTRADGWIDSEQADAKPLCRRSLGLAPPPTNSEDVRHVFHGAFLKKSFKITVIEYFPFLVIHPVTWASVSMGRRGVPRPDQVLFLLPNRIFLNSIATVIFHDDRG